MHYCYPSYTMEMFIADLGGIYGFALGISVITVLEVFDWLLLKVSVYVVCVLHISVIVLLRVFN